MPIRSAPFLALLLAVALSACDTTGTEDTALDVLAVDLVFDADEYRVYGDYTASFFSTDATVVSGNLADALQTVGQGDLVMLYIDTQLVAPYETDQQTYTALPITRGFNDIVFGDTDGDDQSDGDILVTSLTASYEYSFGDGNLYFDVVSSLPYTEFSSAPEVLFDRILPARFEEVPSTINLRLVVIPDELFFTNGAAARVDLRDYEAVKQAYGLPD